MHSGVGKCKKEIYSQFPLASVDIETSYHAVSSTPRHIEGVTCFNFHMVPTSFMLHVTDDASFSGIQIIL